MVEATLRALAAAASAEAASTFFSFSTNKSELKIEVSTKIPINKLQMLTFLLCFICNPLSARFVLSDSVKFSLFVTCAYFSRLRCFLKEAVAMGGFAMACLLIPSIIAHQ